MAMVADTISAAIAVRFSDPCQLKSTRNSNMNVRSNLSHRLRLQLAPAILADCSAYPHKLFAVRTDHVCIWSGADFLRWYESQKERDDPGKKSLTS